MRPHVKQLCTLVEERIPGQEKSQRSKYSELSVFAGIVCCVMFWCTAGLLTKSYVLNYIVCSFG